MDFSYWPGWDWKEALKEAPDFSHVRPTKLNLVQTEDEYKDLLSLLSSSPMIFFDTEFNTLDPFDSIFSIAGLCFSVNPDVGYYVPLDHKTPDCDFDSGLFEGFGLPFVLFDKKRVAKDLKQIGFEKKPIGGHHLKIDLHALRNIGVEHDGPQMDTLLLCKAEDPYRQNGLKSMTARLFGYEPVEFNEIVPKGTTFNDCDPRQVYEYAAADPVNTMRLAIHFAKNRGDNPIWRVCNTVEFPLINKIVDIERFGVALDTLSLEKLNDIINPQVEKLERSILKLIKTDINLKSSEERYNLVYDHLHCPYPDDKRPERKGGADDDALKDIETVIPEVLAKLEEAKEKLQVFMDGRPGVSHALQFAYQAMKEARHPFVQPHSSSQVTKATVQNVLSNIDQAIKELKTNSSVLKMISSYSKLMKLQTAFVNKLPKMLASSDGKIHTEFNQMVRSGRQSGLRPNLMQLPRDDVYKLIFPEGEVKITADIRGAIKPPEGYKFVCCDSDAMEMKMAAAISQDKVLLEVVNGFDAEGRPFDPHLKNVELMGLHNLPYMDMVKIRGDKKHPRYKEISLVRDTVKPLGFAVLYGSTEYGLAAQLNKSVKEARRLMDKYFGVYRGIKKWLDNAQETSKKNHYAETPLGRRRNIPDEAYEDEQELQHYLRACGNHEIQGTCGDMAKFCERQACDAFKGRPIYLCNFIHDELIAAAKDEPQHVTYAAAVLFYTMRKKFRGVDFTATPEVKTNLSKNPEVAPDLMKTYPSYNTVELSEEVAAALGLSPEELALLPF